MRNTTSLIALSVILFLTGCAGVPKDAVDLSKSVNTGIASHQSAYLNLFNQYFAVKRQRIDDWIANKYLPTFIANVREEMKAGGKKEIDDEALKGILSEVLSQRDSMQEDLEKTRLAIWEKVTRDHVALMNASVQITALLQSMVDVKEASQSFAQTADKATGGRFNFSEFDGVFDQYIKKAGDFSSKGSSLLEQAKPLIEGVK